MKIMHIDDDYEEHQLVSSVIREYFTDCVIHWVNSVDKGIKKALEEDYDFIFSDVVMPGRWGYDACREIKKKKSSARVFILTGSLEGIDSTVAREAGADDIIIKDTGYAHLRQFLSVIKEKSLVGHSND